MKLLSTKNKRPDSLLSQQKLPTWQPIINFRTSWKIFVGVGVVITAVGVALVNIVLAQSEDVVVNYSKTEACIVCENQLMVSQGPCSSCLTGEPFNCQRKFQIPNDLQVPVYVYYELDPFYQNHRSYVSSRDDLQLAGMIFNNPENPTKINKPSHDGCKDPFLGNKETDQYKYYFPCGAIANSMFSDKFKLMHDKSGKEIALNSNKIVWQNEKDHKYKNPPGINMANYKGSATPHQEMFQKFFMKPRDWTEKVYEEWWKGGGMKNNHFINWMHPAPMARFRKLYAVITTGCEHAEKTLCSGNYTLHIDYNFAVARFNGTKSVVFSTTTFLGTRKPFVAWFTLGLGIVGVIVGFLFYFLDRFIKVKVHPRRSSFIERHTNDVGAQTSRLNEPVPT